MPQDSPGRCGSVPGHPGEVCRTLSSTSPRSLGGGTLGQPWGTPGVNPGRSWSVCEDVLEQPLQELGWS